MKPLTPLPLVFMTAMMWLAGSLPQVAFSAENKIPSPQMPPVVTLTAPVSGFITNQRQVTVAGTVTAALSVKVNRLPAVVSGNTFSVTVPLEEGPNQLIIMVRGACAQTTKVKRTVIRDSIPPVISFISPMREIFYHPLSELELNRTIRATVRDETSTEVKIASIPATRKGTQYSAKVRFFKGRNEIFIMAADAAGNVSTLIRYVTCQVIYPFTLSLTYLEGNMFNSPRFWVSGIVWGETPSVSVAGIPVKINEYGAFGCEVQGREGLNRIRLVARDVNHARIEKFYEVIVDTIPPVITIASPPEGSMVSSETVTIQGRVIDAHPVNIHVESMIKWVGEPFEDRLINVTPDPDGCFTVPDIRLGTGHNLIKLVALDEVGHYQTMFLNINRQK